MTTVLATWTVCASPSISAERYTKSDRDGFEESSGTGGTLGVHAVIGHLSVIVDADDLRVLPADVDDVAHLRVPLAGPAGVDALYRACCSTRSDLVPQYTHWPPVSLPVEPVRTPFMEYRKLAAIPFLTSKKWPNETTTFTIRHAPVSGEVPISRNLAGAGFDLVTSITAHHCAMTGMSIEVMPEFSSRGDVSLAAYSNKRLPARVTFHIPAGEKLDLNGWHCRFRVEGLNLFLQYADATEDAMRFTVTGVNLPASMSGFTTRLMPRMWSFRGLSLASKN